MPRLMRENRDAELATRTDVADVRRGIEVLAAPTKKDLELLDQRLTIKPGIILASSVVIVGGLVAMF